MPLDTNIDSLVKISVMGEVANPSMPGLPASPYLVSADGEPLLIPAYGGLVYNVRVGDRAGGWAAELIQPGVSIKHPDGGANTALGVYACIGNRARVMTGRAAGAQGTVIGKSGRFAEHVICDFTAAAVEEMAPGDRVQVQALGVGLELNEVDGIDFKSCAPELLEALNPDIDSSGRLVVPVKAIAPSILAGAGAGLGSEAGALNLQTSDPELLAQHGLEDLRFGDLVAVENWDSRYGHGYLRGSVIVGVVCQGASFRSGYGPGIAVIMSSRNGKIAPVPGNDVNLVQLLDLKRAEE